MRYMGGKARIAKYIAPIVNACRGSRPFWEPFAGGLNMTPHLAKGGWGFVSDAHPGLAALYEYAIHNDLPRVVTREQHADARALPEDSPIKAFIGFGCSFGGMWFSGYAKDNNVTPRDYADQSARAIERDARASANCTFGCVDFLAEPPRPVDFVLYLDPPYRGTTGYFSDFDSDRFEELACMWSEYTDVFVSEYEFPVGEIVREKSKHVGLRSGKNAQANSHRIERLYHLVGPH